MKLAAQRAVHKVWADTGGILKDSAIIGRPAKKSSKNRQSVENPILNQPPACQAVSQCGDTGADSTQRCTINHIAPILDHSQSQPRAIGTGRLSVVCDGQGVTRLQDLRQSGSLKLVFPRTHTADVEAVLVNTAGGITGGDRFTLELEVQERATLTLTTQAAERAYRAQSAETGTVRTKISVQDGACMKWLPQELILFDRSALRRRLEIELSSQASLLMVEPVVFGRAAMPEVLRGVLFEDRIAITRAGRPLYRDAMVLRGDATAHLARAAIAGGAGAMASVVMVGPDAHARLAGVRALLPDTAGASMLADDVLLIRLLATDSFTLRRSLIPMLEQLSNNSLPMSWRL